MSFRRLRAIARKEILHVVRDPRSLTSAVAIPLIVLIAARRAAGLVDANPFYAANPPPLGFVLWSVVWVATVLGTATWWFERRDL